MPDKWSFPVRKSSMLESSVPVPPHLGAFGIVRKHHTHEGVDIYVSECSTVRAVEPGTIVTIEPFTGSAAGSPWWHNTQCIMVEGESGVVCYGEVIVQKLWKAGDKVGAGYLLGHVKQVLREDKGRPMSMLHLELYEHGVHKPVEWSPGASRPKGLMDPTEYLKKSFENS